MKDQTPSLVEWVALRIMWPQTRTTGDAYQSRANRAQTANDLNRCRTNLQMALTHYREAARIYRLNNHITKADAALRSVAVAEENIRQIDIARASVAATVSTRN